ncbi:MAG TPA: pyridoxamine 5'-phosphate oxidase family protein [Acidimicrobiales bacterium]|nr:pyridoxamine 5'-phosphate oxidase family protein [Acidimicrobiales bacterium]
MVVEYTSWDNRRRDVMSRETMFEIIENADTCVFTHLRKDGAPVSAVVGGTAVDGEVYTLTSVLRLAYTRIQHDPRCSVIFDIAPIGSVTIMGRAEVVDDPVIMDKFFEALSPTRKMVRAGHISADDFTRLANTPNRRLFHVIPERWFATDLRTLDMEK